MVYYQIRIFIRRYRSTEYIWRQQQCMVFLNNHPTWNTFWDGDEVQWECTRSMDSTHWQKWIVLRKTRGSEWNSSTGGTHAGSKTQVKILTYGSMKDLILIWSSIRLRQNVINMDIIWSHTLLIYYPKNINLWEYLVIPTYRRWHTSSPRNKFVGSGRHNWVKTINKRNNIPKRNCYH